MMGRMGIQILAIAVVATVAAAVLPSCKKSETDEDAGEIHVVVEETQDSPESADSHTRRATISSNFPCNESSDCTFTEFANVPKSEKDCACLAACTPFVINAAEKARREAANKKFCSEGHRSASGCPSPPCGFISFEDFECVDGKCTGYARVE